jgi:hypothetical protein
LPFKEYLPKATHDFSNLRLWQIFRSRHGTKVSALPFKEYLPKATHDFEFTPTANFFDRAKERRLAHCRSGNILPKAPKKPKI